MSVKEKRKRKGEKKRVKIGVTSKEKKLSGENRERNVRERSQR